MLFIITHQHRADHVGFDGYSTVRTPNLDAIATRGTEFEIGVGQLLHQPGHGRSLDGDSGESALATAQ